MNDTITSFERLRPRLQGIAYRMLGSMAEAEEVVQDAWLRWHEAAPAAVESDDAWLVTVTTRIAIDRLRAAKVQREHYVGLWLPEPQLSEWPTPEEAAERADDVSVAFLAVLERLTPEARAAFLMREVFDADYDEVARTLGKSEASCRQLVHRAREQVREARPRFAVAREVHQQLMHSFADALGKGDIVALKAMLTEDAELIGDGGGKVPSFGKPVLGGETIANLYYSLIERFGAGTRVELAQINGEWGLLRFVEGKLESAQAFETDGERIVRIHVQRNPDKLARIVAALNR